MILKMRSRDVIGHMTILLSINDFLCKFTHISIVNGYPGLVLFLPEFTV